MQYQRQQFMHQNDAKVGENSFIILSQINITLKMCDINLPKNMCDINTQGKLKNI